MHRVIYTGETTLHPGYKIPADVLDGILGMVRQLGWEIISIDQVRERLELGNARQGDLKPFACFTSDDGYADNLTLALPVFRKHNAPLCVNIATAVLDRSLFYWWGAIEELALKRDRIDLPRIGHSEPRTLWARNYNEKMLAYETVSAICHEQGDAFLPVLRALLQESKVDAQQLLDRDALTMAQARELAADPLVTIGAHGVTHSRLSRKSEEDARIEMIEGRRMLENWLGVQVRHFAYPFGRSDACGPREFAQAKEVGFKTAVTTRQGNIFPEHRDYLQCLPRRSIPVNQLKLQSVLYGVESLFEHEPKFQTV